MTDELYRIGVPDERPVFIDGVTSHEDEEAHQGERDCADRSDRQCSGKPPSHLDNPEDGDEAREHKEPVVSDQFPNPVYQRRPPGKAVDPIEQLLIHLASVKVLPLTVTAARAPTIWATPSHGNNHSVSPFDFR